MKKEFDAKCNSCYRNGENMVLVPLENSVGLLCKHWYSGIHDMTDNYCYEYVKAPSFWQRIFRRKWSKQQDVIYNLTEL